MGGGGGGGFSPTDIKKLEEAAKKKLTDAAASTSRHIFISFAVEDENEVNLLRGQAKDERTDLQFDDFSLKEAINSKDDDYIKLKIREQIDRTSVTAVYLTDNSVNSKWVNWEIEESIKRGKGVIGVYKGDTPPKELPSAFKKNKCKAVKWSHEELSKAIEEASIKR